MKNRLLLFATSATFAGIVAFGVTACDKQGNAKITENLNTKITPANVAKLSKGMTESQVNALFGPPTTVGETKNFAIFSKHTNTWTEGKESLSVVYKNSEVEEFNSTVGSTTATTTSDGQSTSTTTTTTKSQ